VDQVVIRRLAVLCVELSTAERWLAAELDTPTIPDLAGCACRALHKVDELPSYARRLVTPGGRVWVHIDAVVSIAATAWSRCRRDSGVRVSRRRDFVSGREVGAFGRETWRDHAADGRRSCHMAVARRCGRFAVVDPCCGSGDRVGRPVDRASCRTWISAATPEGRELCRTHRGIGSSWSAMSTVV
jgi:hypothetical protein